MKFPPRILQTPWAGRGTPAAAQPHKARSEMDYESLALGLIEEQHIMTLATAGEGGPWAAPVYYAFLESAFYFFSDPSSRHIEESLLVRRASAAIFSQVFGWRDIRGIQMSGAVEPVAPGPVALRAIGSYLKKFPFTMDFFNPSGPIDLEAFFKPVSGEPLPLPPRPRLLPG